MTSLRLKPILHIPCCLAAIIACGPLKANPEEASKDSSTSQTVVSESAELKMHAALSAAGFSKFAAAIEAAGLMEALQGEGPFTCFAPTDEAFDAMPDETKTLLKEQPASESAQAWVKYHFIKGLALNRDDLEKIADVKGYADKELIVWVTSGKIAINRVCEVTRFDIEAENGVIHEVSRALDATDEPKVFQIKSQ